MPTSPITSRRNQMGDNNTLLYRIPYFSGRELHFCLRHFNGKPYLDLRIWHPSDGGDWKPTRKGITLSVFQAGSLQRGIEETLKKTQQK